MKMVLLAMWIGLSAYGAIVATVNPSAPVIVEGQDVTFTVDVVPAGAYTYQWFFEGSPLLGRTGQSLRLQKIAPQQQGLYSVSVRKGSASVLSSDALLTVGSYPRLALNGQTNVVIEGSWNRFDVSHTFAEPHFYQWNFNDTPLTGETNSFLLFESASSAQAGLYTVTVSNLHAGVVSNPYILETTSAVGPERWNWLNPPLQGNDLSAVAFGHGLYVAVGSGGAMMVSTNGLRWENRHQERFGALNSILFAGERFVAVGWPGRLITSVDGTNWTLLPQGGLNLGRIAFGNGVFVVTIRGDPQFGEPFGNRLLTSTNGVDWTLQPSPFDGPIRDIVFGLGLFVAQGLKTYTSPDGINWSFASDQSGSHLAFANDRFVCNPLFATSTNGSSWISASPPNPDVDEIAGGNGIFVAVRTPTRGDGPGIRIYSSPDGLAWTPNPLLVTNNLTHVSFAGGQFFASGDDGIFLISTNGLNWQMLSSWDDVNLNSIAEGEGRRIAVGDAGRILISNNEGPWEVMPSPGTASSFRSICFGLNQFVLLDSSSHLFASPDGQSWNLVYSQGDELRALTYGAGRFIAVGDNSSVVVSTNAISWERVTYPLGPGDGEGVPSFGNLQSVTFSNGRFFTGDGYAASSSNGVLWDRPFTTAVIAEGVYGNGLYVGNGPLGLFVSTNLSSWKHALAGPGLRTRGIAFVDGVFALAGSDGNLYFSADGEYWTRHYTSCENSLRAVIATAKGTLLAVGNNGAILESSLPQLSLGIARTAPGHLLLEMRGIPGRSYILQATSSLTSPNWQTITTFKLETPSLNRVESLTQSNQFYRVVYP